MSVGHGRQLSGSESTPTGQIKASGAIRAARPGLTARPFRDVMA